MRSEGGIPDPLRSPMTSSVGPNANDGTAPSSTRQTEHTRKRTEDLEAKLLKARATMDKRRQLLNKTPLRGKGVR